MVRTSPELAAELARIDGLLRRADSKDALQQSHALLRKYPGNIAVMRCVGLAYLLRKQPAEAEYFLTSALRVDPSSPDLLNEIGRVKVLQGEYGDAVTFFERALEIDSAHSNALSNLADTLTLLRQPAKAKAWLDRLIRIEPFSARALIKAADNSLALNDVDTAIYRAREAVRLASQDDQARLSLADALEVAGHFTQARYHYLTILRSDPQHVTALARILADRTTQGSDHYAAMASQQLRRGDLDNSSRVQLHLGLARYCDRRQKYSEAFNHLAAGNQIRFSSHPFDSAAYSRAVDRIIAAFNATFLEELAAQTPRNDQPIFIVGMPRSGTTLVEHILASHSSVKPGGELSTLISLAAQIGSNGGSYPEDVATLAEIRRSQLAQQYLNKLNEICPGASRITDKMPFNFMHIGLIHTLFPNARIIHCRRDPLDTCLSCFFTTFSEPLQFASSLATLGHYYLDYRRLMEHWQSVVPTPIFEMQYEHLINDTQQSIRGLLEFCGLDWQASCATFYRTSRSVRTPSRWQVRQPIYHHSVSRWKNYEQQLQPLRDILQHVK